MFGDDGTIIKWVENGEERSRSVRSGNDVFRFPESFPEASRPGARIETPTTVYYHDIHGGLHHYDNHPSDNWWDRH